jgi:hypothetical protein
MAITLNDDGYCEIADIERRTQQDYSDADLSLSEADVEEFIKERADLLNAALKNIGYSVPIPTTAVRSSRLLRSLNSKGAAADAENSLPGVQQVSPRTKAWMEAFDLFIKQVSERKLDLPDATKTDSTALSHAEQQPEGVFNPDSDGVEQAPTFDRDTVW